jgi:hypothetical protein
MSLIQDDRKVTQSIPDTRSICQKVKYIEIRKNIKLSVGNVHRVQPWVHPPSSSCLKQHGEEFVQSQKRSNSRDTVDLFGTGEQGNAPLNSSGTLSNTEMPAVFDSEHRLHLYKRHPCTWTV